MFEKEDPLARLAFTAEEAERELKTGGEVTADTEALIAMGMTALRAAKRAAVGQINPTI